MSLRNTLTIFSLLFIYVINSSAQESKFSKQFIDSVDHNLDVSEFLNSDLGFLPVPIVITEPALGIGGGLALTFFHKEKTDKSKARKGLPPIVTAVAGGYTSNGTWFGMLAHQGSYLKDRIRYTGALGYLSPNLSFYTSIIPGRERAYEFNMQGLLTFHELLVRPKKDIPLFIGFNYVYFNNNITFKTESRIPALKELTNTTNLGGINLVGLWDKRNNAITPTRGIISTIEFGRYSEQLGGDNNYWHLTNRTYGYVPIVKDKLFSAYRLYLESKWDEVPFFELPYISLRGIPILRYQNKHVSVIETEWRYQAFNRWSFVGFVGSGIAMENYSDILGTQLRTSGGAGFRYLIARQYGIHTGIDIARGPEEWAWYITVGSSWFR